MRHLSLKIIISLLAFLFCYSTSSSQSNFVIHKWLTKVSVKNGKKKETNDIWIKVNDKASSHVGEVEIPYKATDKIRITKAEILDNNKEPIRSIKKKNIITKNAFSSSTFHSDFMLKEINFDHGDYPYYIHYTYETEENEFLWLAHWLPVAYSDILLEEARLTLYIPDDYPFKVSASSELKNDTISKGKTNIFSWRLSNFKMPPKETQMGNVYNHLPKCLITPDYFNYGIQGTMDSWVTYGQWHHDLNQDLYKLAQGNIEEIKEYVGTLKDKEAIVARLYKYLQENTRYINVSLDIGGMKPIAANIVSNNQYGDCKGLTVYMKSLLDIFNIESYYTVIHAGSKIKKINTNHPSQQFNHVILAVPIEGDTIWLENTSKVLPYGLNNTFTQGRKALLVKNDDSQLIEIPALKKEDVETLEYYTYSITSENELTIDATVKLRGPKMEQSLNYLSESDETLEKKIKSLLDIPEGDFLNLNLSRSKTNKEETIVSYSLNSKAYIKKLGSNLVIKFPKIALPEFDDNSSRKFDIAIDYPINNTASFTIPLEDKMLRSPITDELIESSFGKYLITSKEVDNQLIIKRNYQLNKGTYPKESFDAFNEFIKSIRKNESRSRAILKKKT